MNSTLKKIILVNSVWDLIKNIVIIGLLGTMFVLGFFYFFLPASTNHGESVTVPDLIGLEYTDLDKFLTKRSLRYEINPDSGFTSQYPPLAVLKQFPEPGSKVKENRKIYLSLNAINPPSVRMPRLIDGSLKNAEIVLESYGLIRGEILYKPDLARNAVLEQLSNGSPVAEGDYVAKGSKIDLWVGDGMGKQIFEMPDLTGMDVDEAKVLIMGSSLVVGDVNLVEAPGELPGSVIGQSPSAGRNVRIGRKIELWVASSESDEEKDINQ
ncbi:PASTA domain-containing protein [Bacteroidota bacterium]